LPASGDGAGGGAKSLIQRGARLGEILAHELYTGSKFRPRDLLWGHPAFDEGDFRRMFPGSPEFLISRRGDRRAK
jgi:hypothetical protein